MRNGNQHYTKVLAIVVAAIALSAAPEARAGGPYGPLWNSILVESTTPKEATDSCGSTCGQNARRRGPDDSASPPVSASSQTQAVLAGWEDVWRQILSWLLSAF